MVGIVIVSHQTSMADDMIKFLDIFKTSDFNIINGSDNSIAFGTTVKYVEEAIKKANQGEGVLLLVDLGSSIDISMQAIEKLKNSIEVEIADAPLLEGAISAVAANDIEVDLKELKRIAEDSRNFRKVK